ncbi:MAG: AI-2E family transporter [Hydrogenophaga sp.]|nr:AI-2E family transporter [Hydrogenophaga sp.]
MIGLLTLGLALLAWYLSAVLLMLFGAVIVAVILHAMAAPMQRHLKLKPRPAVAASVVLALLFVALVSWLIGDRLTSQFEDLRERLPTALTALFDWLRRYPIGQALLELWDSASVGDVPWTRVAYAATQTLNAVGTVLLMALVGVYLAIDPRLYRVGLVRLVPPAHRERINDALLASGHALSRWLVAQSFSMLFVGITTAVGLALLDVPLALTLGVIAGLLAFVPFFGAIAAGVLAVLMAFTQGPTQALYVGLLSLVIQQVEGNVIMPLVERWAVSLAPALAIMAAVIFGVLFGLPGLVLSTPLMVVTMVLVKKLYVEGLLEGAPPSSSPR